MFEKLLARRANPEETAARALYQAIVTQAREGALYRDGGVPDSVDGRFELVVLHSVLVLRRLKAEGEAAIPLAQELLDMLFLDMDESLREMGVGDLSVGKKIKAMAQAFYGRISAYETGLQAGEAALAAALGRNLLGTVESSEAQRLALARYVAACEAALQTQDLAALRAGRPDFPAFAPAGGPAA